MEEDMTIPNAIFMNRNLIAILIDYLVDEGVLTPEARDGIIAGARANLTPHTGEVRIISTEAFIRDIFAKGNEMRYTEAAPTTPVCPSCGVAADPSQRFCTNCGSRLR